MVTLVTLVAHCVVGQAVVLKKSSFLLLWSQLRPGAWKAYLREAGRLGLRGDCDVLEVEEGGSDGEDSVCKGRLFDSLF